MKKLLFLLCLLPAFAFAQVYTQIPRPLLDPALIAAGTPGKTHFANLTGTNTYDSIVYDSAGAAVFDGQWIISNCSSCNFTVAVMMKNAISGGVDVAVCQSAAAIAANGTFNYHMAPETPVVGTSPGLTTICPMRPPRTFYIRAINVSGTATLNGFGAVQ